jgi:hypothetical protein
MRRVRFSLIAIWLSGFAALTTLHAATAAPGRGAPSPAEATPALQELPPQRLATGQCALVAWTLSDRRRVFMALSNPAVARLQIDGATRELPRQAQEGAVIYGHAARQTFADAGMTLTLDVEFDPDRRLLGGATIRRGALELKAASGWATIMPIGGLVACEP